jgi:oxygen-independent coproporphyrinogen-3 oxidase
MRFSEVYNGRMTGLYVHIPFCARKCHYCDFVITTSQKHEEFISAIKKEAVHHAPRFEKTAFDTLYLGGGTPSAMSAEELEELVDTIRKYFFIREDAEVTCEANPDSVDAAKATRLKAMGVNRVSLGAQSFHDATLARLNRAHDARAIGNSFMALREAGFVNLSLDLMLSLPDETLDDVRDSLERVAALDPEHVSLYELTIEKNTVFGRRFREGRLSLPDENTQVGMLALAREFLKGRGWRHYELLSYAKPGFESRHNRIYWENGEYLGLGPGAFSYFDGRRFRTSAGMDQYLAKAAQGDWSAHEEETLTPERREVESFLLALRLSEGADVRRFSGLIGKLNGNIHGLEEKGLLILDEEKVRLTDRGRLFAETVFAELC